MAEMCRQGGICRLHGSKAPRLAGSRGACVHDAGDGDGDGNGNGNGNRKGGDARGR
jgi:hypothetical protein